MTTESKDVHGVAVAPSATMPGFPDGPGGRLHTLVPPGPSPFFGQPIMFTNGFRGNEHEVFAMSRDDWRRQIAMMRGN